MKLAVEKETFPEEKRVALVPGGIGALQKAGFSVVVESGSGRSAGFVDQAYTDAGATIVSSRDELDDAEVLLKVRAAGAGGPAAASEIGRYHSGQTVIAMCDPLGAPESLKAIAATGVNLFALELIPRITRAQSMDVLSSMATIAGYRAVLLAALESPQMFPLMMTAAGTLKPVKAFVIGAGVAGLQAIATSRRLGAVVRSYDIRPAVREQVESLGARFVALELETGGAEDKGGYAKAMDEEFYRKQREKMAEVAAESDVIITTAAIPGRKSPLLITADAVRGMAAGSVIVDLAAERGGNCELTKADEKVVEYDVTILGPTNLPAEVPGDASQMYSKNICTFLLNMTKDGVLNFDLSDEIIRDTLVARGGEVVNNRVRDILGMSALPEPERLATAEGGAAGQKNP